MKTYRISPALAEVEHKRSLMHSSAFIAVVMVAVLLFGGLLKNLGNDLSFILYSVVSMGLLIAFALLNSVRVARKRLREMIRSFELVVDESSITKSQADTPPVRLAFSEIAEMTDNSGKGTCIKTADSFRQIGVPCTLDGYQELLQHISAMSGVSVRRQNYAWLRTYALAVVVGVAYLALLNLQDRRLVLFLSGGLSITFGWCLIAVWRNPNATCKLKRQMLVGIIPLTALVVRFFQAW